VWVSEIADRLGDWWEGLSNSDKSSIVNGHVYSTRLNELATNLRINATNGGPDTHQIGDLVRKIEGTSCRDSLLREAIRQFVARIRTAYAEQLEHEQGAAAS
jgi:hypothetical protein